MERNLWANGEFVQVEDLRNAWENMEATDVIKIKWQQGFVGANRSETKLC